MQTLLEQRRKRWNMIGAGKWLDKAKFIYVSKEFEKCISLEKIGVLDPRKTSGKIENTPGSDHI